jgi:hypothetical protein
MSPLRHFAACFWLRVLLLGGLFSTAQAHDTIIFDAAEAAKFSPNGAWGQSTPTVLHAQATAILRSEGLDIDLTMADGAAYKLLDPNQVTTGVANATTDVSDAQFEKDKPLLIDRARTFFKLASNGAELKAGSVSVELTSARDTIFHLIFPSPAPGTLHLEITYLGQIPAGAKDLITVLDRNDITLGSATLGANNPSLDVTVSAPGAQAIAGPAKSNQWLFFAAGAITVATVLILLSKLRKAGPGRQF